MAADSGCAALTMMAAATSAPPPPLVAVFGGQGIASGQMAELRRCCSGLPAVRSLVESLSHDLTLELQGLLRGRGGDSHPAAAEAARELGYGLDIGAWARGGRAGGPSMEYLSGGVVSLVLT
jgi:hypothetical protein|eukprot:SAG25_NODE_68_length_17436_cov_79.923055_17_plen_122_part_00